MYDRATGYIGAPIGSKEAREFKLALKALAGKANIKHLYSDGCPSIKAAADEQGIVGDKSHAGCPPSNPFLENMVRILIAGTRVTLEAAGLPSCFWPYALAYYCHSRNIFPKSDGSQSA